MKKEKLLLHSCCAPCSVAIINELKDKYSLVVFFYNPNIYPEDEYIKRKKDVIKMCKLWNVPIVDIDFNPDLWNKAVKGLEDQPESGNRCTACFAHRLIKTVEYAVSNNFDCFASSLTSGRNKKAKIINKIGLNLALQNNIKFLEEDWKKGGRQEIGINLVSKHDIYRQDYCGCKYSKS